MLQPAAEIYFFLLCFLVGACAGSFLNCAAERHAAGGSVFRGRSKCPVCGRTLGVFDLIPIFSYVFLGGRCRKCGARIPVRCLFCELLGGFGYLAIAVRFGFSFETAEYLLLFSALFLLALIDGDTMEMPDGVHVFAMAVYLVFLPFTTGFGSILRGLLGAAVLGGGMLVLALLLGFVLKKDALGGGDVKLFAVLGFYLGFAQGILMIIFACIAGLVFACMPRAGKEKEFPFGPAITVAAFAAVLIGQELVERYLALFL